jgi:hypothetical protein
MRDRIRVRESGQGYSQNDASNIDIDLPIGQWWLVPRWPRDFCRPRYAGGGDRKVAPPPELTKMSQKKFALGMGEIVIFALGMHKKFIIEKTTFLAKFF